MKRLITLMISFLMSFSIFGLYASDVIEKDMVRKEVKPSYIEMSIDSVNVNIVQKVIDSCGVISYKIKAFSDNEYQELGSTDYGLETEDQISYINAADTLGLHRLVLVRCIYKTTFLLI